MATLGTAATYALHCHSCYNSSSHQQQAVVSYLYTCNVVTNTSYAKLTNVLLLCKCSVYTDVLCWTAMWPRMPTEVPPWH
eukprot:4591-Heterococcus_DN1.PRE.2